MKKSKRKIACVLAVVSSIIILAASLNDDGKSLNSSDIFTVEALAASENNTLNCVTARGFCIIDGIPNLGVAYKE